MPAAAILTILHIIELSLEITLEVMKSIPADKREEFMAQHLANVAWWTELAKKFQAGITPS